MKEGSKTTAPNVNVQDILNALEAAQYLNAHVETIRKMARNGEIPCFKIGIDWRFSKTALIRWSEQQQEKARPATVLAIDDDELVLKSICGILKQLGCRPVAASDGNKGLALIADEPPDLVLLDLKMPGMTGPQFLKRLRADHKDLPVIIVTGHPDSKLMSEAMPYGPLTMIAKPIEREQLERAIKMAIAK